MLLKVILRNYSSQKSTLCKLFAKKYLFIYLNFASSVSEISKTVRTTILKTTQVIKANKSTYTAPKSNNIYNYTFKSE